MIVKELRLLCENMENAFLENILESSLPDDQQQTLITATVFWTGTFKVLGVAVGSIGLAVLGAILGSAGGVAGTWAGAITAGVLGFALGLGAGWCLGIGASWLTYMTVLGCHKIAAGCTYLKNKIKNILQPTPRQQEHQTLVQKERPVPYGASVSNKHNEKPTMKPTNAQPRISSLHCNVYTRMLKCLPCFTAAPVDEVELVVNEEPRKKIDMRKP